MDRIQHVGGHFGVVLHGQANGEVTVAAITLFNPTWDHLCILTFQVKLWIETKIRKGRKI